MEKLRLSASDLRSYDGAHPAPTATDDLACDMPVSHHASRAKEVAQIGGEGWPQTGHSMMCSIGPEQARAPPGLMRCCSSSTRWGNPVCIKCVWNDDAAYCHKGFAAFPFFGFHCLNRGRLVLL